MCRLWDAITDPAVANISDRLASKHGRRIPCMAAGALPACAACSALFLPPVGRESSWNVVWLAFVQALFFMFFSLYCTPYGALFSELSRTPAQRLNLSTYLAIAFGLGSLSGAGASTIGRPFGLGPVGNVQAGALIVCTLACVSMYVPVFAISETKYCARPTGARCKVGMLTAMHGCLANKHFRAFASAELAFSFSNTLIMTGMPYYLQTLLRVDAGDWLMPTIGTFMAMSFVLYYPVNLLARRYSKKPLVLLACGVQVIGFLLIGLLGLGTTVVSPAAQLCVVGAVAALPMAVLGVLPTAILGDIVAHASRAATPPTGSEAHFSEATGSEAQSSEAKSSEAEGSEAKGSGAQGGGGGGGSEAGCALPSVEGKVEVMPEGTEGMFFAARTLVQKMGTTLGVMAMASLSSYGELGIRLSAVFGILIALATFALFSRYDEREVLRDPAAERPREGVHTRGSTCARECILTANI